MWQEPLAVTSRGLDAYRFVAEVADGGGSVVGVADGLLNRDARCGYLGELRLLDANGGVRQRRRALVLLIREACRHAQALGVTQARAEATASMRALAERLSGRDGRPIGARFLIEGDLAEIRTRLLAVSDAEGND
jgi:hypothetical protein